VPGERVPAMSGLRCLELAGPERIAQLLKAPNTKAVRRRKDGKVVEIQFIEHGDDSRVPARQGNPRRYSHDHETDQNPANNWMLKHLGKRKDYDTVVRETLKAA